MAEFFSKWVEKLWEKEKSLITSNFSFSNSAFKRLVLQKRKNQGLFGKGLIANMQTEYIGQESTVFLLINAPGAMQNIDREPLFRTKLAK